MISVPGVIRLQFAGPGEVRQGWLPLGLFGVGPAAAGKEPGIPEGSREQACEMEGGSEPGAPSFGGGRLVFPPEEPTFVGIGIDVVGNVDSYRSVPTGGGEAAAVRAEDHAQTPAGVAAEGGQLLAAGHVPQLHRLAGARGEAAAVGAEDHSRHVAGVTTEGG